MSKRLYSLALMLLISLVSMAQTYSVAPMNVGNWLVKLGDATATVPIRMTNYGSQAVNRISYTLYNVTTQVSTAEREFTLSSPLGKGETAIVQVPLGAGSTYGKNEFTFHVTKVDGNYNSASVGYTYIDRYTVKKIPHRRVLAEDYTALWCPNCPSGIIAMESLERLYPDDFVGVAVHSTDALASSVAYQDGMMAKWGSSYPSVWINRKEKVGGWDGRDMFVNNSKVPTPFEIGVKARWNAAKTDIQVETTVEACMTQEADVTYAVAYVLTISGLTGYNQKVDASYKTENNASVFDPEFAPFKNLDNYYNGGTYNTALTFNHVAIASQGINTGVAETVFSQLAVDGPHYFQTTFDNISQYSLVNDPTRLTVIAILINQKTGQVENVAKCSVSEPSTSFELSFDSAPWKTLYSDRAYTLPVGIEAYAVDEAGHLLPFADGTHATDVAAHTALLLKSAQGSRFTIAYTDNAGTAPAVNSLYGFDQDAQTFAPQQLTDADVYYYKLAKDASKGIGFYWGTADGGVFTSKANRCYLVLKRSALSASMLRGFPLEGDATGIVSTTSPSIDSPTSPIYDLSGKQVKAPHGAGVYIIDGKKVVRVK